MESEVVEVRSVVMAEIVDLRGGEVRFWVLIRDWDLG